MRFYPSWYYCLGTQWFKNAIAKSKSCRLRSNKENQWMKSVFKLLQKITYNFGQAHQLASCWTYVCKAFSTFRIWVIEYISYLQIKCEIGKSNARLKSKHPVLLKFAIKTLFTPSSHKVCFVIWMTYSSISILIIKSSFIDFMFFTRK